ncbi:MAG: P22 phage major capsid protein family protein [Thiohalomonadales bacterium]
MALSAGKIAEVYFEKVIETYEHQMQMLDMVNLFIPDSGNTQNAGNVVWRPVQQHAPIIEGFDLTGKETGIIEETVPAILGTPKNDFVEQRIDNMRDRTFWERRGVQSGKKQATELNRGIAALVANTGSLFYRTNSVSGYDAVAESQTIMVERQTMTEMPYVVLNSRDKLKYAKDLAGRQTVQGRPEDVWAKGQIGNNIDGADVFSGSFLPNLIGGADPGTTTTAAVSEKPEGGSVAAGTNVVTNVDYRTSGVIPVVASGSYNVGDRVTFGNGGTDVQAVGLADKNPTGQAMTFTIVTIPNSTSITVWPKPIALDDGALSTLEKAYANIDTVITSGATVNRLNTDALAKTNIFFDKSSIEVTGGSVPMELLSQFDGMRVIPHTLKNGLNMYMIYDGNIATLNVRFRLFTWYGLTNLNPSANGAFVTF